jgi:arsenite/tail-anchored protein-transporting ATPase
MCGPDPPARLHSGSLSTPPRTILYTGKGGVGKTSVAAATARRCAGAGLRTLVLSTDPAHSLADVLEQPVAPEPTEIGSGLWAQQVHAQRELERNWALVQRWAGSMLVAGGVNRIAAEELTVPPGGDELFSLLTLKRHHEDGGWDVIVVDCAPTGETLRLLSFPDVARWWLQKVFGREQQLLAAARPMVKSFFDVPLPDDDVFREVQRLIHNLVSMNELLRDSRRASIRLVMTPDRMVIAEAMRTYTYLNLYGYLTDAVIVNREFPAEVGDYFGGWREVQRERYDLVRSGFDPLPLLRAPFFEQEVVGPAMLDRLGDALFVDTDPAAVLQEGLSQELIADEGGAELRLELPFADKGDIALKKVGLELVVSVDGHKRTIVLPTSLGASKPSGARFDEGRLVVRFDA